MTLEDEGEISEDSPEKEYCKFEQMNQMDDEDIATHWEQMQQLEFQNTVILEEENEDDVGDSQRSIY